MLELFLNFLLLTAEFCEGQVSVYYSMLAEKKLNTLLVYIILVFVVVSLRRPKSLLVVTYTSKHIDSQAQEKIKEKVKEKADDLKKVVNSLKASKASASSSNFLKKVEQAYKELSDIQTFHNQFKEEIIDSHTQIIKVLDKKTESVPNPKESSVIETKDNTKTTEKNKSDQDKNEIYSSGFLTGAGEPQDKTRKNSESSENKIEKIDSPAPAQDIETKVPEKIEESKEENKKFEIPKPKIFTPRPAPVSTARAPVPIRGKAAPSVPSERPKYAVPSTVKSNPFG